MTKNKQTQKEIKFRAWDGKKMFHPGTISEFSQNTHEMGFGGYHLMQYTGLKDKNGVEIYEGDILCDSGGNKGVIVWFQGNVQYILNDMCEYVNGHYDEPSYIIDSVRVKSEIIGNIYSNPEMLSD